MYSLAFNETRTYLWSAVFVLSNLLLPQVCHLIPQGGIVLAPLSFVIMAGTYHFGWKPALLAAVLSPLVNHYATGMPAWGVLQVMTVKLIILALVAGLAAQHFRKATLPILAGVVVVAEVLGGLGELALTGGIAATIADFTIGWLGLILQILGTYFLCKKVRG